MFVIPSMTCLEITNYWGPISFKLEIMLSNLVLEAVMEGWGKLGRGVVGAWVVEGRVGEGRGE